MIKCANFAYKEKLSILRSAPSLNKRSEIFGHCIHRKKFLLSNTNKQRDGKGERGREGGGERMNSLFSHMCYSTMVLELL